MTEMVEIPERFAWQYRGEAMAPLLMDGDTLEIHQQDHAEDGQVVVAQVGDEFCVRRLVAGELRADNPAVESIAGGFEITGRVMRSLRELP